MARHCIGILQAYRPARSMWHVVHTAQRAHTARSAQHTSQGTHHTAALTGHTSRGSVLQLAAARDSMEPASQSKHHNILQIAKSFHNASKRKLACQLQFFPHVSNLARALCLLNEVNNFDVRAHSRVIT